MSPTRALLLSLPILAAACSYEPPPAVTLERPEGAVFELGAPLHLVFSVPIDPETLAVRVWASNKDAENELVRSKGPRLDTCRPKSSPCGKNTLKMDKGNGGATLVLDPEDTGRVDVPLVLEVLPGLTDIQGNRRNIPYLFDVQFAPAPPVVVDADTSGDSSGPELRPMEFEDGVYVILALVKDPIPAVLTLITDFKVLDDGRGVLAGVEGDETGDAPKETTDPEKLMVDVTEEGYAVFVTMRIDWDGDNRIMTGDPFTLSVAVGPLGIVMKDIRLTGFVNKDGDHDRIDGTLSISGVTLTLTGGTPVEYDATSTTFEATFVPPDKVPKGTPELCKNLCGAITIGQCSPPDGFPGEDFCP